MEDVRMNVVVDVKDNEQEDNDAWVKRLETKRNETGWQHYKTTIYRVPCRLREIDPSAYEPQILSLGPYHYDNPRLKAMQEYKWFYLDKFLERNPEKGLQDYLKLVAMKEAETREVYSEAPQMNREDWVEMMLLDSCFVIEFLQMLEESSPYEVSAPIPIESWLSPNVLADMLLLENQLPFFLLEELLKLNSSSSTLAEIALRFFAHLMPGVIQDLSDNNTENISHILHLLYDSALPRYVHRRGRPIYRLPRAIIRCRLTRAIIRMGRPICRLLWIIHRLYMKLSLRKFTRTNHNGNNSHLNSYNPLSFQWMPSAKNLENAGVVFRVKTKNVTSFMDITFHRGTLEIPRLQIYSQSNSLFRNLIAFEQCHMWHGCSIDLAAYTHLMDCIIRTPADVDLLRQEGIIISALGNDKEVARFFKRPCAVVATERYNYLSDVFEDMQRYCDKRRNKWKASLNHNYFNNPWATVSVIAAIFLFLLTITQTVLALIRTFHSS